MPYYFSKQSVLDEISTIYANIIEKELSLLTPPEEPSKSLADESDFVSVLWSKTKKGEEIQIKEMRIFLRIDKDLYTDDQFAADQYMAAKHGKTVKDVIMVNKKFLNQ